MKNDQRYYAKAKGWEKLSPSNYFWNYDTDNDKYFIANKLHSTDFMTKMTKDKWNKLGIDDNNADFEKAED